MIFRQPHRRNFVVIDNEPICDDRLSFKAVGVLCYLLSRPDHWSTNHRQLAQTHSEGEYAVRRALVELEECGYLQRQRIRLPDGTFDWEIHIRERPLKPGGDL